MDILFKTLLVLHVGSGSVGLLSGTINLIQKKGGKNHKAVGKFFVYSMLMAGLSSVLLSFIHPNYFLLIVGIFTIYMVATGNRYVSLQLLGSKQRPTVLDWAITLGMLLAALLFIVVGIILLGTQNNFGVVLIVFGAIGLRLVKSDFNNYRGKAKTKNYWLVDHLQRMTGAYIAAATAFLVVNAKYLPNFPAAVFWLTPTILLFPLILSWRRKYTRDSSSSDGW